LLIPKRRINSSTLLIGPVGSCDVGAQGANGERFRRDIHGAAGRSRVGQRVSPVRAAGKKTGKQARMSWVSALRRQA